MQISMMRVLQNRLTGVNIVIVNRFSNLRFIGFLESLIVAVKSLNLKGTIVEVTIWATFHFHVFCFEAGGLVYPGFSFLQEKDRNTRNGQNSPGDLFERHLFTEEYHRGGNNQHGNQGHDGRSDPCRRQLDCQK